MSDGMLDSYREEKEADEYFDGIPVKKKKITSQDQGDYFPLGVKKFHIDNIDLCIQMFSKVPIHTMTLTETVENMEL